MPDTPHKIYKIKWFWRAFSIVWTGLSVCFWLALLSKEIFGEEDLEWWHLIVGPAWIVGAPFWTAHMFLARVRLYRDAIETSGLLGQSRLRFEEILGRREYEAKGDGEGGSTRYLKIEPIGDHLPLLDFMKDYDFDRSFYDWFEALPDLDAKDKVKGKRSSS